MDEGGRSKSDRTRLRFVAAIRSELAASGGFTADTVAKRAQTSPATFYNHFSSKDLALASAFAAVMDDLLSMVTHGLRIEPLLQLIECSVGPILVPLLVVDMNDSLLRNDVADGIRF